jgi:competence protein ComEC
MSLSKFRFLISYLLDDWIIIFCFTIIVSTVTLLEYIPIAFIVILAIGFLIILGIKGKWGLIMVVIVAFSLIYFRVQDLYEREGIILSSVESLISSSDSVEGSISKGPIRKLGENEYIVKLDLENSPNLLLRTSIWDNYKYGMRCTLRGDFKEPESFDEFDYKTYLRRKNVFFILESGYAKCLDGDLNNIQQIIYGVRDMFVGYVDSNLNDPEASLLVGILVGEQRLFEDSFSESLRVSGTTHIIAASGYNVNILVLVVEGLLARWIKPNLRTLISLIFVWVFVVFSGASPSIVRAAIMVSLILISSRFEIGVSIHQVLLLCIAIYSYYNPYIIYDLSFQLSFVSTASLIYLLPVLEKLFFFLSTWLRALLLPTLACTISTAPIILYSFGSLSLIGLISNMVILPVLEITMGTAIIALSINLISNGLAKPFMSLLWAQLDFFENAVKMFGQLDLLVIDSLQVGISELAVMYLILLISVIALGTVGERYKYYFLK